MSSAAAHTQHGAVTVATEPGMTMAGPCEAGDVLGVVAGDFAFVGSDLDQVACDVVDRLLSPGVEMLTLVTGADTDPGLAERVGPARPRPARRRRGRGLRRRTGALPPVRRGGVMVEPSTRLRSVVGDKTAKVLESAFGMVVVDDLLRHYPRRYAGIGKLTDLSTLRVGQHVTIMARVVSAQELLVRPGRHGARAPRSSSPTAPAASP